MHGAPLGTGSSSFPLSFPSLPYCSDPWLDDLSVWRSAAVAVPYDSVRPRILVRRGTTRLP